MTPNFNRKYPLLVIWLKFGILVLVPILLLLLPADFFDQGKPICLSMVLLGQECYACGMTRSIMHLIHFEWEESVYYHPLGFVVFLLVAFLWLRWCLKTWQAYQKIRLATA